MPIYRVQKTGDYTVMSNRHLRDHALSWKSKGLLSYILSLPDNWDFSAAGLATAGADGVTLVRSALKELEELGYLVRRPIRGTDGRISDWEYVIYESPQKPEEKPDAENPQVDAPQVDALQLAQPELVQPELENLKQLNTNKQNTKETNTNITNMVTAGEDAGGGAGEGEDDEDTGVADMLTEAEEAVGKARAALAKTKEDKEAAAARFERWWEVWPRKVAKKAAEAAFARIAPDDALTDVMIAAVRDQTAKDPRFREERYTPHPATWLNGEQWKNEYSGAPDPEGKSASFEAGEFFELALKKSYEGMGA